MRFHGLFAAPAVMLLLGLSACGGSAPPAATPTPTPVVAAPVAAPQTADLRGARAAGGESEMGRRGFTVARQQGLTAYWLHAPSNTCVRTVTSQGRYRTVDQVPGSNCGR